MNQKDLYPDTDAVEDSEKIDESFPTAPDDASDDEPEEDTAEIHP